MDRKTSCNFKAPKMDFKFLKYLENYILIDKDYAFC